MLHLTTKQLSEFNEIFQITKSSKEVFEKCEKFIKERITSLDDKTCLEIGCNEGYHTVELAKLFEYVTATDIRPRNIISALTRQYIHDCPNIEFKVEDFNNEIKGKYDFVFNANVLHHTKHPINHLLNMSKITSNLLLITNLYGPNGKARCTGEVIIDGYTFHKIAEKGLGSSGTDKDSPWFANVNDLLECLNKTNFSKIEILEELTWRSFPSYIIFASK